MQKPILSIVVPSYNSAPLLHRCLRELENQNASKHLFEVIIVNDGSTDNTQEVLSSIAQTTTLRLQLFQIPHSGPAIARNHGVLHARGEWIGFIDADVSISAQWVQTGLNLIQQYPEVGGFEGKTEIVPRELVTPFTHQTSNTYGGRYPTCNLILRRSLCVFYPGYKIPFREDTDLAFCVLQSGYQIRFCEDLLVYHPPLTPQYSRPLALALRYYYDGLLARRFPEKYKNDVDVHQVMGFRISHLRRKIYNVFVFSQMLCLLMIPIASVPPTSLVAVSLFHLFCFFLVVTVHLVHTKLSSLRFTDLLILTMITYWVPWVMLVQRLRGFWHFRNISEFTPVSLGKIKYPLPANVIPLSTLSPIRAASPSVLYRKAD
ncbi:MAG: glycosyltransferase family 2 protein [SAR324 cluster bacterium]|nr:glycosyltransferase family 2 protein [SAR324 cluster bacterium]